MSLFGQSVNQIKSSQINKKITKKLNQSFFLIEKTIKMNSFFESEDKFQNKSVSQWDSVSEYFCFQLCLMNVLKKICIESNNLILIIIDYQFNGTKITLRQNPKSYSIKLGPTGQ